MVSEVIRKSSDLEAGLSVRATEEACVYLEHPLMAPEAQRYLPEVLKSSFCGRFSGRFSDPDTDAGMVWAIIEQAMMQKS